MPQIIHSHGWQPGRKWGDQGDGARAANSWDGAAEETVEAAARTVARTANFMVDGLRIFLVGELGLTECGYKLR